MIVIFRIRLRELRESAGYASQQAFANTFGVAQSTVGNWEAGKREPGYETTIRLANFFNVSVDYLIGRTVGRNYEMKMTDYMPEELKEYSEDFYLLKTKEEKINKLKEWGKDFSEIVVPGVWNILIENSFSTENSNEQKLLSIYRKVNSDGKKHIMDQAEFAEQKNDFKQESSTASVG